MMTSAYSIANLIARIRENAGAPIDQMTLQKHLFYAQAFCFAQCGEELFADDFQAWKWGPVIPSVYSSFAPSWLDRLLHAAARVDKGEPHPQFEREKEDCLRQVIDFFGSFTPWQLSRATHAEMPWVQARGDLLPSERSTAIIPKEEIRAYYAGLIWDGEEALSRLEELNIIPEPRIGYFYRAGVSARKMTNHPLYSMRLAERFASISAGKIAHTDVRSFAPVTEYDLVEVDDF